MSSALRIGAKRVALAAARPAQVAPHRSLHEGQARLLEQRKVFQANPHLHGELFSRSRVVGLFIALVERLVDQARVSRKARSLLHGAPFFASRAVMGECQFRAFREK